MQIRLTLLFFLLAADALVSAQQPQPYDINGVKLGASFSEWRKGAGARCVDFEHVEPNVASYSCPDLSYQGVPLQQVVNFFHGRLISVYMVAAHADFAALRIALKQKFGAPWRTEQRAYPLDGITLNGEHNRWSNGVTSINLAEFGPDRNHSVLFFSHIEIMAEKTRETKGGAAGRSPGQ